ncbi:MAG TPA: hypothetical protein PLJ78_00450 [Anaerolineae bacterium]|nr:hypothetical protein [Anaerolineae bacterium]HQK12398.1 hypothetical protein [Anaerolineae bacterium]
MQPAGHKGRLSSHLADQIEAQTRDLDWTLAHFTFVASVTTLAADCDIAHSPSMTVASSHAVPRAQLAFIGEAADLLANYAVFLVNRSSEIELLVDEKQRAIGEQAFQIHTCEPQWQMVFRGDPATLDAGPVTELAVNDLAAMQALAKNARVELRFTAKDPFTQGPAFGIWEKHQLVAMGVTELRLPGAAQIGHLIAVPAASRSASIAAITAALVKAHAAGNRRVFYIVAQQDEDTVQLFEALGFVRERPMYRMYGTLKEDI